METVKNVLGEKDVLGVNEKRKITVIGIGCGGNNILNTICSTMDNVSTVAFAWTRMLSNDRRQGRSYC